MQRNQVKDLGKWNKSSWNDALNGTLSSSFKLHSGGGSGRRWISNSSEHYGEWWSGHPQSSLNPSLTDASFLNNILPWLVVIARDLMNSEKHWQALNTSVHSVGKTDNASKLWMTSWMNSGATTDLSKNTAVAFQKGPGPKEIQMCCISFLIFCCHHNIQQGKELLTSADSKL